MIYGSGENYGNTDLPLTSHQTDNWAVSCCYDRRRGWEHCHPCLHVVLQANGKHDKIYIECCLWYMSRSQTFGCGFSGYGVFYHAHAFAIMLWALALVIQNAIRGGISHFSAPARCQDNTISEIFFFFFLLSKKKKKKTFISSTFVCTFNLHIKEIPSGPALHIYIWLVTLNEHVKNGRAFFFECARTT